MSKIARVKFIRDKEPNIKALIAKNKVLDGALYVATDTGTMWMGTSATSLIQIKDNINTNTTYTLTKSGSTITLKGSDGSSVNITDSNTIYNNATASAAGLMSAADKSKLDSVATGANKTVVDASFVDNSTNPVQSKVVKSALDGKSNTGHKHVKADITDFPTSMPASDVYAWAKAATKPSYSKAEVGLSNVDNTADAKKSVKYATSAGSASTATTVVNRGAASGDVARHVWFSDSSVETARVSDDNFKYNPNGNLLTTNISGNAATASSVTWGNVSGKPSAFTPASHTHDDRYYTESEINSKLSGKANSSHTHTKSQITDFPSSMPASDVYAWAKASSKPSYSKAEVGLSKVDNTADANKSVKYATSAGSASTATTVVNRGAASGDVARHVWFSDSSVETARVSDDNFKYNPNGNLLTTNISGNAATASSVTWGNVSGKPSAFTPASHTHDDRYYTESEINSKLSGKANSSHTHTKSQITDFPSSMPASDVYAWAKASSKPSYSWSEISNKPTIPSVGNGTITITQNGATKGSFTLNQSGNATIALTDNDTKYSLPAATSSTRGGVKVGSNITNSSGTISLTKANVTAALGYTPPTSDTNTWRPEEVIISSTQPSASTCKLWIKI